MIWQPRRDSARGIMALTSILSKERIISMLVESKGLRDGEHAEEDELFLLVCESRHRCGGRCRGDEAVAGRALEK